MSLVEPPRLSRALLGGRHAEGDPAPGTILRMARAYDVLEV
jgi:hypothetical protein